MAIYKITHSCGHVQPTQIYGTNTLGQREQHAAYLAGQECDQCKQCARDQRRAGMEPANADAHAAAAAAGWPTLTGTTRQTGWAASIRRDAVTGLRAEIGRRLAAKQLPSERLDAAAALLAEALIRAHVDAGWWIDSRNGPWISRAMDVVNRAELAAILDPERTNP